ncbi:peptidoglycan DD-metalloendopeptidase family protein [Bacillus sp. EB600]|uniref:peptidoglycan DD-metalloendopeptidase family protein n=1 Tax=Bacillus sp. EB600 TaxID=2806345 RepID=UPI00210BDED3|nr:peptidoglycan DD-metalloendopeptidase family protein [Bacillus sp. EB600]MCQ6277955.1 peptidoglycan DD-metalloendopeptidase family protein [Bacillus sp. EB600]
MRDYIRQFLIAGILALCVGLFFLGGEHSQASMLNSSMPKKEWIWPADGIISDTFGTRQGKHKGIDIAGKLNSPIFSVDNGVVEKSYYSNSYGNVIFINHQSNYVTVYAHLSERLVTKGQQVKKGETIGKMGRSGQATGVHLHFETHQSEWTFDKKYVLDPEGLLGDKKLGEVVQAGAINEGDNALEASSRFRTQEEHRGNKQLTVKNNPDDTYVVQQGDTLSSIARNRNIPVGVLKKTNHLTTDLIKTEQILIIPKK